MSQYDYENSPNVMNDTAKRIYESSMDADEKCGTSGLHIYKTPHLWEEENLIDIKDSPTDNFIPMPTMSTGEEFSSQKTWKKIAIVVGAIIVVAVVVICAVGFFKDYVF